MISAIDLVSTIYVHHVRFQEVVSLLPEQGHAWVLQTSLSYNNLKFRIEHEDEVQIECNYMFDDQNTKLLSRYFRDPQIERVIDKFIGGFVLQSGEYFVIPLNAYRPLSETVNRYISIAESIALEVYQCASGDNYSPSCFSKIIITGDGIILEQNNHMNAKSLAHKNDYSLRDLEFFIPFDSDKPRKKFFDEEYIGTMRIRFSDRSSPNNKVCGDKIRQRIDSEQSKFT